MNIYRKFIEFVVSVFSKIAAWVVLTIGKIKWSTKSEISSEAKEEIRQLLVHDYFIILTRRKNHLSTYSVNFADFVLRGKWGYWAHALMNLEDEVQKKADFKLAQFDTRELIESTGSGVHITPFDKVFNVHSVALLKPKHMPLERWTDLLDRAKAQLGKPYDSLFNIADDRALSCVELCRYVLQGEPDYETNFANFEALIKKSKNLSPQMIYDCGDFEVVFEAKV